MYILYLKCNMHMPVARRYLNHFYTVQEVARSNPVTNQHTFFEYIYLFILLLIRLVDYNYWSIALQMEHYFLAITLNLKWEF